MASERKIHIGTELDTSGMLAGINQMRQLIGSLSVDSNLFKDVTKDLDKMSKLTISIASSLKNGVPEKELNTLLKDLSTVGKISSTLPDKIRQISIQTNNIRFPTETLNRLDEIERDIEKLGQEAKNALGSDLRKALRDAIPNTIISNKTLDNILKAKNVTGAFEDELVKVQSAAQKADKELDKLMTGYIGSNDPKLRGAGKLLSDSVTGGTLTQDRDRLANLAAGDLGKADYNAYVTAIDKYIEAQQKSLTLEQEYANLIQIVQNSETTAAEKAEQITNLRAESQQLINEELEKNLNVQKQAATVAEQAGAKISSSTEQTADSVQKANTHLQHQDSLLKQIASRATSLIGIGAVFNYITRGIRDAWNGIKDLDKEFTQIAVVTDKTTSQLWSSYGTYSQMAQGLGVATKDAVATSALYYQQGLDTADVMTLTAETIKMAQIAGMDFATATNQMTAAIRGFNLEMNQASMVNDIFSTLAANAAVSTQELSYALTKTASIAESAGMSIDTTSAFLTKMIETTREAPENIGTAMKSIVARFEELKKNPLALTVDVEGEEVVANKVEAAIALAGVKLRDASGQFRDLDDVFLELAKSWDGLDRNTQRYIATIAAGSRQQSRFIALMDGYDRTLELTEIAQDSEGQSAAQFLKTLDSLDSKLNRVGNSLEQLYQKFVNSDFFGGLLEGLNNLLQGLGKMDATQLATFIATGVLIGNALIRGFKSVLPQMGEAINAKFQNIGNKAESKLFNSMTGANKPNSLRSKLYLPKRTENAKEALGQKKGEANNRVIEITVKKEQAEAEINELETKLEELKKDNTITITAEGNLTADSSNDEAWDLINDYESKMPELKSDLAEIEGELKQAQEDFSGAELELPEITDEERARFSKSLGNAAQAAGPALVAALGTSIATAISSDNPFDVFITGMLTFVATATPTFVSTFLQLGIESGGAFGTAFVEAGGPIIIAITAALGVLLLAVTGIKAIIEASKPEIEKISKEIEQLQERQEDLDNTAERSQAEASVQKIAYKNLNKLLDSYDELYNKSNRTTEENEKLSKVIEDIANDFPDLVEGYDEAGNAVIKQKDTWDEIIQKQKESLLLAQQQAYQDKTKAQLNQLETLKLEKRKQELSVQDFTNYSVLGEKREGYSNPEEIFAKLSENGKGFQYMLDLPNFEYADQLGKLDKSSADYSKLLKTLSEQQDVEEQRKTLTNFLKEGAKNTDFDTSQIEVMVSQMLPSIIQNFLEPLEKFTEQLSGDQKIDKQILDVKKQLEDNIQNYILTQVNVFGGEGSKKVNDNFIKELTKAAAKSENYDLASSRTLKDEKINYYERNNELSKVKTAIASDNNGLITQEEKDFIAKLNSVNDIPQEFEEKFDEIITKFQNGVMDTISNTLIENLDNLGEYLTPEELGILQSFDAVGEIGREKIITTLKEGVQDGILTSDFEKYITQLEAQSIEVTEKIKKNYEGSLETIGIMLGEKTVKLFNEKLGNNAEKVGDMFVDMLGSFDTDKLDKIAVALSQIDDWGNIDQLKNLSKIFYEAGNGAKEAADNVMKFANAMGGAVSLKIDKDYFNSYFTELGKTIQDTAKEYKDLYSAMEEYKDMGRLSAQTIIDLVASGKAEYLTLDENTGALKLNTQAIEDNWHAEMEAATASLDMEIAKQEAAQAGLKIQLEVEKRKLEILQNAKNKNGAITAAEYNELRKLDEAYSVDIINNQIDLNTESLIQDGNFFTDLLESREKGYGQLVQQAVYYGKQIQEALISGATSGNTFTPTIDLSNAWAEQEKENRKASAKAKMMPDSNAPYYHYDSSELDALIAQEDDLIKALEGEIKNRDEVLNQLKETKDKIKDITVNSSFADYMKDTGKATKDANEELKKYISSLERFYNLNKEIEEADRKQSKAKKAFEKDRSLENGQAYLDATVEKGALGLKKKKSGEEQEKKDRGYARNEFKELLSQKGIKLSPEGFDKLFEKFNMQEGATGQLDQRAFKQWLIEQKNAGKVTYDNAQDIENLFKEWLGLIDDDLKMQIDGQDQYEESLEEIEDFKDELKEIKEALDPLVAIKAGIEAANKIIERAKEDLEDYYTSGGKQGINIAQYGHTVGSAMSLNDTTLEKLENYKNSLTSDNSELMKYLVNLGEGQWTYDYSTIGQITDKKTIDAVSDLLEKLKEVGETEEDLKKKNKDLGRSFQDALKKNRLEYSNLVNRVAQAMADLDQKEIDEVKKKYAMIQEEDDKYLEALQKSIDKQRQLREQAKSYDDLEKDEKRLALLERDTSGANAAEIAALREQIKDKRENLVDTEQDNIVNKISEDNENRKNKMDEETQFLQNVMDERTYDMQYYIEKAYDIVDAAINGDEGAYQRMLEILKKTDAEFYRTTKEGQQIWFESLQESWTHAKDHALAVQTELIENLDKTDSQVHENLTNFAKEDEQYASDASDALDELGNKTNTIDFTKCWDELKTSCEEAKEKMNEVLNLINGGPYEVEARVVWNEIGKPSDLGGGGGSNGVTTITDANKNNYKIVTDTSSGKDLGLIDVNSSAYKNRVKSQAGSPLEFVDITDLDRANKLQEKNWGQSSDRFNNNNNNNLNNISTDATPLQYNAVSLKNLYEQETGFAKEKDYVGALVNKNGLTGVTKAEYNYLNKNGINSDEKLFSNDELGDYDLICDGDKIIGYRKHNSNSSDFTRFAKGGLVDFTGPAWVDGTKTDPEAFLTAEDTRNIQALTSILQNVISPATAPTPSDKSEVKAGDTNIEIHIDVEKIEDDYDVEQMLDTIESRISEASKGQVTIVK